MLIGTFLGLVLYGITLHQVYRYSRLYSSDRIELKFAVYCTVVLETVHMALSCHTCYYYLVSSYFEPEKLEYPTHAMEWLPILSGLIISTSQAFFARRAYLFTKGWYRGLVFLAVACLVSELGFCVATTIFEYHDSASGFGGQFVSRTWLIACASGCALGADTILTTVLITALRQNRSGVKRTDSVLDVLVLYTITTGFITSVSVIALFLCVIIIPAEVGIFTAISVIMTKFYANTLLAALNSRRSLNDRAAINIAGTDIFGTEFRRQEPSNTQARPPVSIALQANTQSSGEQWPAFAPPMHTRLTKTFICAGTESYGYGTDSGFGAQLAVEGKLEEGTGGIEVRRNVMVDIC
ncbi:hypothetical protein LXA43DRAFT_648995 [Ganoderma leucocontextum]|nr:hypothetical protein LXA43DRAFT_648995 [Ganoderma leucocontextum]